jgi:hypothetical protein
LPNLNSHKGSIKSATDNTAAAFQALSGNPNVDIASNIQAALRAGRRASSILKEVIQLARGPGRLTPQEYFYYRLWDPDIPFAEKRRFVGKRAQHSMHMACNSKYWYCATADKILFHTIMKGAGFPVPELLAIAAQNRCAKDVTSLPSSAELASFLRQPELYPIFIKPVDGKYSLSVFSVDHFTRTSDQIMLLDGSMVSPDSLAAGLTDGSGNLVQRRLRQAPALVNRFGPRLWSVRILILIRPAGPVVHRAVAKIATGVNPADNYWRPGNMLGAIDLYTGRIWRVVRGTGAGLVADENHRDTGNVLVGTSIPNWGQVVDMVQRAATVFAGIRTQSWDVALTDHGPVLLEANYGGDLNLAQLASGEGVLDHVYAAHLEECRYQHGN